MNVLTGALSDSGRKERHTYTLSLSFNHFPTETSVKDDSKESESKPEWCLCELTIAYYL